MRAALLTVSSSRASGGGLDESGARLAVLAETLGADVAVRELVADDRDAIEERLLHWADVDRYELVLTSGGTGFAPSDVTPEATRAVVDREAPGLAEAMRRDSRPHKINLGAGVYKNEAGETPWARARRSVKRTALALVKITAS